MKWSRWVTLSALVAGLGAPSIGSSLAQSQGSGSAGSAAEPAGDPEDEGAPAGSGSATVLVAPALPAQKKPWLAEKITAALTARPTIAAARIGVAVRDVATGETLFAFGGDAKLNLASNTKVLTSIAALATLGNGFRWRTAVLADALPDEAGVIDGDLYLRGKGDPLLTAQHLDELAANLEARGVTKIDGRLVLDASYFDAVVEPPHFDEQPKERAGFRAPVAAIGVARSAVTISVIAEPNGGARLTVEPAAGDYVVATKKDVTSVTTGRSRMRAELKPPPPGTRVATKIEYEVTGHLRVGEGSWDFRRRVDDPTRFAGEVFRAALARHGITVRQRALAMAAAPLTAKVLAVHDSAPLPDVLRFMNKTSDNYVAESVLKTLGAETRATPGPATWADGTAAVTAALGKLGLAPGSYRAENGSGLFASNELTAMQMVALLAAAHGDYRIGPDLVQSLPIGGADGTLAKRWRGRPAQGRVRAKTGTLDKVATLAGFIATDSKAPLAFAVLVNDIPTGQRAAAKAMADDIVNVLAAYLGAT